MEESRAGTRFDWQCGEKKNKKKSQPPSFILPDLPSAQARPEPPEMIIIAVDARNVHPSGCARRWLSGGGRSGASAQLPVWSPTALQNRFPFLFTDIPENKTR